MLANTTRLSLLAKLARRQPQCVSELARQCSITVPVASQALRALESRGLIKARRIRRRVEYHIPRRDEAGALAGVLRALLPFLRHQPVPHALVCSLSTAFTHPARIQIHRALQSGPKNESEIGRVIRLSPMARWRHLRKLTSRGFIRYDNRQRQYQSAIHPEPLGRALSELAAQ